MQTEKPSSYTANHKKFYERHREEIREKRKASDHDYYERNKERIKARVLAYYHARKAVVATPAEEAAAATSPATTPAVGAPV